MTEGAGASMSAVAMAAAALAGLVGAACSEEEPEQSFAEGMTIVCAASPDDLARLPGRLKNRQVRELVAAAASQPRHRLPAAIDRAARRAGLTRCRILDSIGPVLPFDPPSAAGKVDIGGVEGPLLVIATDAIRLEERAIVPLVSGKVPDSAMRDGPLGLTIQPLVPALQQWVRPAVDGPGHHGRPASTGVGVFATLLVAPSVSYRVVFQVIASARDAGASRFVILVASPDGSLGAFELRLPQHVSAAQLSESAGDPPVQLIVSLTERKLLLWSLSGLEGTLQKPRLELAARPDGGGAALHQFDTARLQSTLAALADARWAGGVPPDGQREIIVQGDRDTPFQTIVDVMVAAGARADGRELFPDVLFGRWSFD
jgi:biopolymer transport protein ExbD